MVATTNHEKIQNAILINCYSLIYCYNTQRLGMPLHVVVHVVVDLDVVDLVVDLVVVDLVVVDLVDFVLQGLLLFL